MANFTTGPWEWDDFSGYIFSPPYEFPIAHITNPHNSFDGECSEELAKELEANARLIALAPDMYEMLLDCSEHLAHIGFSPWADKCYELLNNIDGKDDIHA